GDLASVGVAEFVEGAVAPAGGQAGDQDGGECAEGGVVVFALACDEIVVAGGEGGIDVPGDVRGLEQGLAQSGISLAGGWAVAAGQSGLADTGNQAGEGADTGQAGEAVRVAEPAQDARGRDDAEAGPGGDDLAGVGFFVKDGDPVLQGDDLRVPV